MINVSKLKKGIVIDHIRAGHGYKIFQQLGLDQLGDVVVLIAQCAKHQTGSQGSYQNRNGSGTQISTFSGLIDPGVTISFVEEGERVNKMKLSPPQEVKGILTCKNPRCITNQEHIENIRFRLVDPGRNEYACEYLRRAHAPVRVAAMIVQYRKRPPCGRHGRPLRGSLYGGWRHTLLRRGDTAAQRRAD